MPYDQMTRKITLTDDPLSFWRSFAHHMMDIPFQLIQSGEIPKDLKDEYQQMVSWVQDGTNSKADQLKKLENGYLTYLSISPETAALVQEGVWERVELPIHIKNIFDAWGGASAKQSLPQRRTLPPTTSSIKLQVPSRSLEWWSPYVSWALPTPKARKGFCVGTVIWFCYATYQYQNSSYGHYSHVPLFLWRYDFVPLNLLGLPLIGLAFYHAWRWYQAT